jgi:4-hydroxybenzoate polyprenyltransferase
VVTSPIRRLGYRLFGKPFDYILHLRPAEWPIMAGHTTVGYLLGVGLPAALLSRRQLGEAVLGIALWVICLNGGTLALNSAFDRDEGDIGYLKNPPPTPARLAAVALLLMVAGQLTSLALPMGFRVAYAICFAMSVAYSVPPLRLKAVPGADWIINMWGFGTITPYAGYALSGRSLDPVHGVILLAFCPLFACLYPLTQIYQFEEDRARGDRTLALQLGERRSLIVAVVMAGVAFTFLGAAGVMAGWGTGPGDLARWAGLGLAALAWAWVLGPWIRRHSQMRREEHQAGMYAGLRAWAVTDVVVILAWGLYT